MASTASSAGLFAVEHVEEVGGVGEVVARRHRLEAVTDAVVRGDDGRRAAR